MTPNSSMNENDVIYDKRKPYEWRLFIPHGCSQCLKWLFHGISEESKMSKNQLIENMAKLARMLSLLEEYETR